MTRIKICGLTQAVDVQKAIELGADMLGFIHVPKSPRHVPTDKLAALLALVPEHISSVLVVQNTAEEELEALRQQFSFNYFQFHGDEPPTYPARFGGYRVIHVRDGQVQPPDTDELFLLDTQTGKQRGGTGKTFDWTILPSVQGTYLVAGGLGPDNVGELVSRYRPWGVDVSSGIEARPGHKDHAQMQRFVESVRKESHP